MLLVLALVMAPGGARAGGNWNDAGIAWRSFEEARAEAGETGKPICLVVYTDWCPHCRNYSSVFHDDEIEKLARSFVMVRLDQDANKTLTARFGPDGTYVPRTMFLTPRGEIDSSIRAPRSDYLYFYDEHDPAQLRQAMKRARAKLTPRSES